MSLSVKQLFQHTTQTFNDGFQEIAQDSFFKCFRPKPVENWNFAWHLKPIWALGWVFRHFVLFPLRFLYFLGSVLFFLVGYIFCTLFPRGETRSNLEFKFLHLLIKNMMVSLTGTIKVHGNLPPPHPSTIFVSNHSSLIDWVSLSASIQPFSVIGQRHQGWVGFFQTVMLKALNPVWFERSDARNRQVVSALIKRHIHDPYAQPLLVFPEGTCVVNDFCMQFKRGVFGLGAQIVPIGIKYNFDFADGYWHIGTTMTQHLFRLMCSWAVVMDVYICDPMTQKWDESPEQFAQRCKTVICEATGLQDVEFDGYYKRQQVKEKDVQARKVLQSDTIKEMFEHLREPEVYPGLEEYEPLDVSEVMLTFKQLPEPSKTPMPFFKEEEEEECSPQK
ncbi:hypothetical protein PCE1_002143 [Barthelona sp. PCE]